MVGTIIIATKLSKHQLRCLAKVMTQWKVVTRRVTVPCQPSKKRVLHARTTHGWCLVLGHLGMKWNKMKGQEDGGVDSLDAVQPRHGDG
jgi:hypothetical protein